MGFLDIDSCMCKKCPIHKKYSYTAIVRHDIYTSPLIVNDLILTFCEYIMKAIMKPYELRVTPVTKTSLEKSQSCHQTLAKGGRKNGSRVTHT